MAKTNTAVSTKTPEYGMEKAHDLPWSAKKVAVLKAIKKLGEATSSQVAGAAGVTNRDARHYGYHAKAGGLVAINTYEGSENKYYFSLTAKAAKMDFDKAFKEQEAAKAAKAGKTAGKSNAAKKPAAKAVKAATNPAPAKTTAQQPAAAPAAGKRTAKAAASSK